jgi:cell fate regulator YaaT (PSP1 superfamily)
LDKNIFLFQIGARDMVKMSPGSDCIVWCNWISLCCKSTRPLPSVEIENIVLQNLEWRDIEKLKWRCWKLKCCLIYELELYMDESKQYPWKWTNVCSKSNSELCWFVSSYNIMNHEVTVRTSDWTVFRLPVSQIKKTPPKPNKEVKPN